MSKSKTYLGLAANEKEAVAIKKWAEKNMPKGHKLEIIDTEDYIARRLGVPFSNNKKDHIQIENAAKYFSENWYKIGERKYYSAKEIRAAVLKSMTKRHGAKKAKEMIREGQKKYKEEQARQRKAGAD